MIFKVNTSQKSVQVKNLSESYVLMVQNAILSEV